MIKDWPVAGRSPMVSFVNNNDVVEILAYLLPQTSAAEHADRTEEMIQKISLIWANQELTKILIPQDIAECAQGLLQDFLSMGHEQEPDVPFLVFTKALIIKGGDDRLAGSGGSHHEISLLFVDVSILL
jgi:hypothetical protein